MLALGRGSDAAGLADLMLEDKLGNYMHGKEVSPHWVGGAADPAMAQSARASAPPGKCRIPTRPLAGGAS